MKTPLRYFASKLYLQIRIFVCLFVILTHLSFSADTSFKWHYLYLEFGGNVVGSLWNTVQEHFHIRGTDDFSSGLLIFSLHILI